MEILGIIIKIVIIIVAALLVLLVVMQESKNSGLSATIGGGGSSVSDNYWNKNKGRTKEGKLIKYTTIGTIVFLAAAIFINTALFH